MIPGAVLILIVTLYFALLFAVAFYADHRRRIGRSIVCNAHVYVLSLGIWHTSWTFYGNVGRVATVGIDFIAIYLGATLVILSWWYLLRKMVRISKEQNLVSIADFVAGRYGRSTWVGTVVTLFGVLGTLPYITLQLKGMAETFELVAASSPLTPVSTTPPHEAAFFIALALGLFGILFGARHLDPSSRHEGLVAAVAFESALKLVAMVSVGLFVCFGIFDGPAEIFTRFLAEFPERRELLLLGTAQVPYSGWLSLALVCMMAFVLLPHMYHVMVVENTDEEHIRQAMWRFPLYMFAIELFIIPIALAGLLAFGGDTGRAEYFSLLLPWQQGQTWLSLLVFLGGLSGSAGMVMVASVALATLILNHLAMPLVLRLNLPGADLSRQLLALKRTLILAVVLLAYLFYRVVGAAPLVNIGLISFVAATQLAPAVLGGLFWKGANHRGALAGILLGCALWLYTLVLPATLRSLWPHSLLLEQGPFGIALLRPEALFGLTGLSPLAHALFWSLLVNMGAFLALSLLTRPAEGEAAQAERFVDALRPSRPETKRSRLSRAPSTVEFVELMTKFIGEKRAHAAITDYLGDRAIDARGRLEEQEIPALRHFTERTLAGSVGAAPARIILENYLATRGSEMEEVFDIFGSVTLSRRASREQLGVLHEAARLVAGGDDLRVILDSILELLRQQFRLDLCVIRTIDEKRTELAVLSQSGMSSEHLEDAGRRVDGETYVGRTFLTGTGTVVNDTDFLDKPASARVLHQEGIKSFAHAPITIEGEPVGVLSVFSRTAKGIFTEEFNELFQNIAAQVGVALRNDRQTEKLLSARERERDLQIARTIQQGLLPEQTPQLPGLALAGACLPAREVGGDYFDLLPRGKDELDVVIADVSGHNVGAALLMAQTRTFIQARCDQLGGAGATLEAINRFFYQDLTRTEFFITMFYLKYHAPTRTICYASAGHNPPLLWRPGTIACRQLDADGLILGVLHQVDFEEKTEQLGPGDLLLLYTDGATEAANSEGELFGTQRLCEALASCAGLPPQEIITRLLDQIRLFCGREQFDDDVSLVVLQAEGSADVPREEERMHQAGSNPQREEVIS